MSSTYRGLEQVLHRIPKPWSIVDRSSPERRITELEGSDVRVEEAMRLVAELVPLFASVPVFDYNAVPALEPSDFDPEETRGWGQLLDLLGARFQTIERFDRSVVREILAEHTPVPDRFLDDACDWFLFLHLQEVATRALRFIEQHRKRQRDGTEAAELVRLATKYWSSVSLQLQFRLVSASSGVARASSYDFLDAVILSPDTEETLREWAQDLRNAKL